MKWPPETGKLAYWEAGFIGSYKINGFCYPHSANSLCSQYFVYLVLFPISISYRFVNFPNSVHWTEWKIGFYSPFLLKTLKWKQSLLPCSPTPNTNTPPYTHTGTQWLRTAGESVGQTPGTAQSLGKTMCATISTGILPQNNPSKNCSAFSLFLLLREAVPSRDGHGYGTGYNKNIKNFNTIAGVQLLSGAVLMSSGLCRDIQRKTEWSLSTGVRPAHYWFP